MKALKDEALTEAEIDKLKQKAEQEGCKFKPSEKTFWISEKNKEKALAIIGKIGGDRYILHYDSLLPQSGTVNASASSEAKSETE